MLNNQEVSMNIPHVNTSRSINNPTNAKIQASKSFSSTETTEATETAAKYLKSPKLYVITSSKISPRSPNPKVQGDGDISASFSGISSAMKTRRLINSPEVSSDNKLLNANNLVVESRSTKKVGGALVFEAKMVSKLSPTAVRAVKQGKQSSSNSALSVQSAESSVSKIIASGDAKPRESLKVDHEFDKASSSSSSIFDISASASTLMFPKRLESALSEINF